MSKTTFFRIGPALLTAAAASGCSISYDIDVAVKGGAVVFDLSYERLPFWRDHSASVKALRVEDVSSKQVVWEIESSDGFHTVELATVVFGRTPRALRATTPAQRLQVGRVYRVELEGAGGGGERFFVKLPPQEGDYRRDIVVLDSG